MVEKAKELIIWRIDEKREQFSRERFRTTTAAIVQSMNEFLMDISKIENLRGGLSAAFWTMLHLRKLVPENGGVVFAPNVLPHPWILNELDRTVYGITIRYFRELEVDSPREMFLTFQDALVWLRQGRDMLRRWGVDGFNESAIRILKQW